jgi:endonuclease-3
LKKKETTEQFIIRKQKALIILKELDKLYPDPKIELNYSNPLELLVAVILSAQCTDKKVNEVTAKLFKKYPDLDAYVNANVEEFEEMVHQTGFYKAKTKNILNTAKIIKEKFNGKVPNSMQELLTLSGVARKSANVMLSVAFNKPEGIVVDTHIRRLSNKFGLSDESDPVKIEKDLMDVIPQSKWKDFSFSFVLYGRYISTARKVNDMTDPISIAIDKNSNL